MVIVCPECTTKFRVNPERIPERGAKVRCARCKHVFMAEKPATEAAPATTTPEPASVDAEKTQIEAAVEKTIDTAEAVAGNAVPEVSADSAFDYNQFREQDKAPEDEPFTLSSEAAEQETPAETENQPLPAGAEESFSFGEIQEEPGSAEADDFAAAEKVPAVATADEALASDAEIASAFTPAENEAAAEALPLAATAGTPKGGAVSSIIRILLLLILGILIIGGVLLYMNGPEQLEQVFQQLIGQQAAQPPESGQIVLKDLEGKFIHNKEVGELFTIRGEAVNKFNETRAAIQVKGVIFDQHGKSLLQKTIFCGNPISDPELQSLPFNKIEELMGNQFGKALSNLKVNKDQVIPFVIVFRDLPQSLAEFSVDVASSKPASQ